MRKVVLLAIFLNILFSLELCYGQIDNHYSKGMEYAIVGDFVEAKKEFEKSLENNPNNKYAKTKLEEVDKAIYGWIGHDAAIHVFKASDYVAKGMWGEAVIEYSEVIKTSPLDPGRYYSMRGTCYEILTRFPEAIDDFTQVIKLSPSDNNAYYMRGVAYLALQQYDKAWDDIHKAQELGYPVKANTIRTMEKKLGKSW